MNWLERAKREIPKGWGHPAAKAADRTLTSATAALQAGDYEKLHGIPLAELKAMLGRDWPECERDPELLKTYAHSIQVRRMREAGIVPTHYTATTICDHCGPVLIFPGAPASVQSCPWCFNRAAGKPVPRAE